MPDLVKIDVEGAELEVLTGMRAVLASGRIRQIACAMDNPSAHVRRRAHELLVQAGYAEIEFEGGSLVGPRAAVPHANLLFARST